MQSTEPYLAAICNGVWPVEIEEVLLLPIVFPFVFEGFGLLVLFIALVLQPERISLVTDLASFSATK